jgi:hypothetical protein
LKEITGRVRPAIEALDWTFSFSRWIVEIQCAISGNTTASAVTQPCGLSIMMARHRNSSLPSMERKTSSRCRRAPGRVGRDISGLRRFCNAFQTTEYGFGRDDNRAFCNRPFNVLVAQENAKAQPNALADDLGRESVTVMQWLRWVHAA